MASGLDGSGRVAAAGWFSQSEAALFLAPQGREEVPLLLIFGGLVELREPGASERSVAWVVQPSPVLAHLDRHQCPSGYVDAGPAEFLRDVESVEAHLAGFLDQTRLVFRMQLASVGIEVRF